MGKTKVIPASKQPDQPDPEQPGRSATGNPGTDCPGTGNPGTGNPGTGKTDQPDQVDPKLDGPPIRIRCVTSLDDIDRAAWDALEHGPSPFLSYGFLRALELSGSIGRGTGWRPAYLLAELADEKTGPHPPLLGAVAAFVKSHSYGEYIFDWSWAGASERAGIPYYPKLVIAAPMTPATGRRILLSPAADADYLTAVLAAGVRELADIAECSSIHWLFCTAEEQKRLAGLGFAPRASYQFHWRSQDYTSYDQFLAQLVSRKRKQLRKERQRVREVLDGPVQFVSGGDLTKGDLAAVDRYYRSTVYDHGGMDYLRPGFFRELARELPDNMFFAKAHRQGRLIAGALYLETQAGLYGRYWGCDEEIEFLHFETAYYAGIERCIDRGIPLFEAGAQGEHKLLRGFLPAPTYSCHWMRHPALQEGVCEFLAHEAHDVTARMEWLAARGPYRQKCDS